jgi:hypothetical protein
MVSGLVWYSILGGIAVAPGDGFGLKKKRMGVYRFGGDEVVRVESAVKRDCMDSK